jgi:ribosomal protein L11 methyltransferase
MSTLALRVEVEAADADALSDALLEAGAASVSIDAADRPCAVLTALFDPAVDPAGALAQALETSASAPYTHFHVQRLEDEDWVRRSQAQFAPFRTGRLWVGASWHEAPADAAAIVRIDPGLAFGTGSHASTRLVLRFLERRVKGGESLLDYGCGSGILAIAAAKLGAARICAVDIDAEAIRVTLDNARANGVALQACLAGTFGTGGHDLVVANILARPLIDLAPLLAARTQAGGRIALAGLLETQTAEVAAAYRPSFDLALEDREEGWALLAGDRR